ncbi:DNA gyrase inhibitor YacG [Syntrophotalea acetylenica]|uniref:DNA gyrase inhibitor YacG n=1 Tax=Syntrophotalea acetylenica TaxID=29542 RepID=UPI002A36C653|nr:DNA gyrase inhibitor YacG [Syntrophotalea acetylenica]MDY0263281.1 DNA gyrase inhibitor YacG [Syntrophotalea acetylenica]
MDPKNPRQFKCPRCGVPTRWEDNPWRPFCSRRCRMVDLGAWIDEEYRVPVTSDISEADASSETTYDNTDKWS